MSLTIERLGHRGDGIAESPVFVPLTLPGELVAGEIAGGRIAVSDMVLVEELPSEVVADPANWVSCLSGAELKSTYMARLEKTGFTEVEITSETPYESTEEWSSRIHSMAITARKG